MGLKEMARLALLQTQTEVYINLERLGMVLGSVQEMGRKLSAEGIRSEKRHVKGRSETRWYHLSSFVMESLIERVPLQQIK